MQEFVGMLRGQHSEFCWIPVRVIPISVNPKRRRVHWECCYCPNWDWWARCVAIVEHARGSASECSPPKRARWARLEIWIQYYIICINRVTVVKLTVTQYHFSRTMYPWDGSLSTPTSTWSPCFPTRQTRHLVEPLYRCCWDTTFGEFAISGDPLLGVLQN